jgi:membrane protein
VKDDRQRIFSEDRWRKIGFVLYAAGKDFFADDGPQWAASIAYYSLLSIFPLLLAAASLASYFIDPQAAIEQATDLLGNLFPGGAGEIERIVRNAINSRASASVLSTLALLWSGSRVFGTLTKALNVSYDVSETYGFLRRTIVELILLLTIGFLFVVAVASRTTFDLLWNQIPFLPSSQGFLFFLLRRAIPDILLLVTFYLIYRYVPRRRVNWKAAVSGTLVALVLFIIARPLFLNYIFNFANFGVIYGSLAVAIIIILWAWIVSVILLLGGEVVSHIQEMMIEGKPREAVEESNLDRSPLRRVAGS